MTETTQPELFDTNLARQQCALSYRASPSVQDLTIQGTWSPPRDTLAIGLESYGREMSQGFAGDANNSPIDGKAVFKKAPHLSGSTGPLASMDAVLEVQSVSPWYMQFFFGMLMGDCTSLSVAGSLPLDKSRDSLDLELFIAQAHDRSAWPGIWPHVPFEVDRDEAPRGASLRIDFAADVPPDYLTSDTGFAARMPAFASMMTAYWNRAGNQVGYMNMIPKKKLGRRELSVLWETFGVNPEPFVAILTNHLIWVHHHEVPIEKVTIRTC
jgi:hypothetical protein